MLKPSLRNNNLPWEQYYTYMIYVLVLNRRKKPTNYNGDLYKTYNLQLLFLVYTPVKIQKAHWLLVLLDL